MYPVLVVEGVAHKVKTVEFNDEGKVAAVSYFEGDKYKHVDDVHNPLNLTGSEVMDLSKALIWNDRYQPIYETLEKVIDDECDELNRLAIKHVESDKPFEMDYQKEYKQLQQKVFGLMDAQELVTQFMVEDIDLSGGDEIAEA